MASGTGNTVRYPWITSNPKKSGCAARNFHREMLKPIDLFTSINQSMSRPCLG